MRIAAPLPQALPQTGKTQTFSRCSYTLSTGVAVQSAAACVLRARCTGAVGAMSSAAVMAARVHRSRYRAVTGNSAASSAPCAAVASRLAETARDALTIQPTPRMTLPKKASNALHGPSTAAKKFETRIRSACT